MDYRSVMPINLNGPGDTCPQNRHGPTPRPWCFHDAMVDRIDAVATWANETTSGEFLHVDDMTAFSLFVLGLDPDSHAANTEPTQSHMNVDSGVDSGTDVSIDELASMVARASGYKGRIVHEQSNPEGTPRILMKANRLSDKARVGTGHDACLKETYDWFLENADGIRGERDLRRTGMAGVMAATEFCPWRGACPSGRCRAQMQSGSAGSMEPDRTNSQGEMS